MNDMRFFKKNNRIKNRDQWIKARAKKLLPKLPQDANARSLKDMLFLTVRCKFCGWRRSQVTEEFAKKEVERHAMAFGHRQFVETAYTTRGLI